MKKTIAATATLLIIFVFGMYFMISQSNPKEDSITPSASESALTPEEKPKSPNFHSHNSPAESKVYKLKSYNGNIAVFNSDSSDPIRITSVSIEELPPADQELLKKGIEVFSEEELITILEDYCS